MIDRNGPANGAVSPLPPRQTSGVPARRLEKPYLYLVYSRDESEPPVPSTIAEPVSPTASFAAYAALVVAMTGLVAVILTT